MEDILKDYLPDRLKKAKALLEKKYNEEFEITQYAGQQMMESFYTVNAAAMSDGLPFKAYIDVEGDGFSDCYGARRLAMKYSDIISRNLDAVHGYVYVYSSTEIDDIPLSGADVSVKEFSELYPAKKMNVNVFLCSEDKNAESLYETFGKAFEGIEDFSGLFSLYIADEKKLTDIQNYIETNTGLYYDFKEMTDDCKAFNCSYKNGRLQLAKDDFVAKAGELL